MAEQQASDEARRMTDFFTNEGGGNVDMRLEAHVKLAGLQDDQRMKILTCARAVRDAKNDRQKRRKALEDLDQCIRFFESNGVLTHRDGENIWYTLNRGI